MTVFLLISIPAMLLLLWIWLKRSHFTKDIGPPDAIFVLGGPELERQEEAVQLAHELPHCNIFISSGKQGIIKMAGLSHRMTHNRSATDTVTNFTTMMPMFNRANYKHIVVVTSDYHFRRARVIGNMISMSYNIHLSWRTAKTNESSLPSSSLPTIASNEFSSQLWSAETNARICRDVIRTLLWLLIGVEGSHVYTALMPKKPIKSE
jgi:hypothetical protein